MISTERRSKLRRVFFVLAPIASVAFFLSALMRPAGAQAGPPVIGVGNVVADFDWTTESFSVYRALAQAQPRIDGKPTQVVVVDHPVESPYAVTGTVTGHIEFVGDPPRFSHELTLKLDYWAQGKKVGGSTSTCKNIVPASQPDYRYQALQPCVQAQVDAIGRALSGK